MTTTELAVPLFDLRLTDADLAAVAGALRDGELGAGPRVGAFEERFAAHLGARHAVAVSSCTAALHLAYLAAGVGPGDEVIVPSITFAATANAALYCGATPVFADIVGLHVPQIDPEHVETLIGPRTRAVCAVHFAGYPAAVDRLRVLCDQHGIALVEDTAHAPLADLSGRPLGTFGSAGAFSFFSNKVLSCGEGGLLCTDDDEIARRARALRAAPMDGGTFDYRFDGPRAALLTSRLAGLAADVAARRALVHRYRRAFAGIDGLGVPFRDSDVEHSSCYVMPVVVDDPSRRGPLRRALRERHGVQTSLLYPSIHEFTAFRERYGEQHLPRSQAWSDREVTVPLYPHLGAAEQDRVIEAVAQELAC
ncbi:DegT/DnrJ/EryC1/StrS family aminotransferase [Actinomycetospora sp. OC33-EN08]|uniref:DegT/DnrJ/EryC1/StrS family aminotransferase n=1 Tax=Actinomycetospora aurantiaca TaxID=3129233 RepID=A0ABU8MGG7_9PSEU